jgi:hypothetical protein
MDGSTLLGVVAALGASLAYNGAIVVQGTRAQSVPAAEATGVRLMLRLVRDRVWLAGIGLDVLGFGLHALAMTLAPLTVVQPALALGLLLPLAVGAHAGHTTPRRREVLGVLAVMIGVTGVALLAPDRSDEAASGLRLGLALGTLVAVVGVTGVLTYVGRLGPGRTSAAAMLCTGVAYALSAVLMKLATNELDASLLISAGALALCVVAVDAFGLLQETQALQHRPASQVSAFVFGLPAVLPALLSPLAFGEEWSGTPGGGAVILAFLALTLSGAVVLASSPMVAAARHVEAPA